MAEAEEYLWGPCRVCRWLQKLFSTFRSCWRCWAGGAVSHCPGYHTRVLPPHFHSFVPPLQTHGVREFIPSCPQTSGPQGRCWGGDGSAPGHFP